MSTSELEPLIYRTEVLGIMEALADIVVELREMHAALEDDEEAEDD